MLSETAGGNEAMRTLGPVSLVLIPSGVFTYLYSDRLLGDIGRLPTAAVRRISLFPSSVSGLGRRLGILRVLGFMAVAVGALLLLLYIYDYTRHTEAYQEDYQREAALFGCVAGILWIAGALWLGYLPASAELGEYMALAESGSGGASEIVVRGSGGYERAVFDMAISAGAVALGGVWWAVSGISLVVSPDEGGGGGGDNGIPGAWLDDFLDSTPSECPACGAEATGSDQDRCPYCNYKY